MNHLLSQFWWKEMLSKNCKRGEELISLSDFLTVTELNLLNFTDVNHLLASDDIMVSGYFKTDSRVWNEEGLPFPLRSFPIFLSSSFHSLFQLLFSHSVLLTFPLTLLAFLSHCASSCQVIKRKWIKCCKLQCFSRVTIHIHFILLPPHHWT